MNKDYRQKGQLSIFLGISLVVIISFMAFIVNVGMFVKAKINLQNAVDAAAWSGAAVQSRQLTNIAYLNWEMRNTYKEWMFKYYVLGQMGLTNLEEKNLAGKDKVNFRLHPFSGKIINTDFDKYNIPSTCIHFGSSNNICKIYSVPGLPRFETNGLPSLAASTTSFMNAIVKDKAKNCSTRSTFNMGAAMVWAYGMGKHLFTDMPAVAAHRVGAWPEAFELALRMRNLEAVVNRPPVPDPICTGTSTAANCTKVEDLDSPLFNYNERPAKAFVSAFRNLSGGASKDNIEESNNDYLVSTFTLTELSPNVFTPENNTLSRFLIPSSSNAINKYYLDLQAYPLNFVTFYTHFVPTGAGKDATMDGVTDTTTEGACPSTKVAIPVPGYLFGFVKNPEVVTYYAVKGSAKFVGMFYPFRDRSGIELNAFAAAKPYGARIGPRLFEIKPSGQSVFARSDRQKRSGPYVSYLKPPGNTYEVGDPIPSSADFWVSDPTDSIGGSARGSGNIRFVIPNLLYQFNDFQTLKTDQAGTSIDSIAQIKPTQGKAFWDRPEETLGLYSTKQYIPFRSNLPDTNGAAITAMEIDLAIEKVRRPTNYEALNYLIPTYEENPENMSEPFDALPLVTTSSSNSNNGSQRYYLYAPLFGERTLYQGADTINAIAAEYIENNNQSITLYIDALRETALRILKDGESTTGGDLNDAANAIYFNARGGDSHRSCTTNNPSMAQKFYQFFKGSSTACGGIKPLQAAITEYIFNQNQDQEDSDRPYSQYYTTSYYKPDKATSTIKSLDNKSLMTAYMPGKRQGVDANGTFNHPFLPDRRILMKRNYYSTKFISLKAISDTPATAGYGSKEPIYSEDVGPNAPDAVEFKSPSDLTDNRVRNLLDQRQILDYINAKLSH